MDSKSDVTLISKDHGVVVTSRLTNDHFNSSLLQKISHPAHPWF